MWPRDFPIGLGFQWGNFCRKQWQEGTLLERKVLKGWKWFWRWLDLWITPENYEKFRFDSSNTVDGFGCIYHFLYLQSCFIPVFIANWKLSVMSKHLQGMLPMLQLNSPVERSASSAEFGKPWFHGGDVGRKTWRFYQYRFWIEMVCLYSVFVVDQFLSLVSPLFSYFRYFGGRWNFGFINIA